MASAGESTPQPKAPQDRRSPKPGGRASGSWKGARRLDSPSLHVRLCRLLANDRLTGAAGILSSAAQAPSVQSLRQRVEAGGALLCTGICPPAQPFLAALCRRLFTRRTVVIVVSDLKAQENVHQDLETWLSTGQGSPGETGKPGTAGSSPGPRPAGSDPGLHFYPAWEILPHDNRLPHADVISDRLETLLALATDTAGDGEAPTSNPPILVTSVVALMQRTFSPRELRRRTRRLNRGDRLAPLELAEWLEEQGYEPEAQATHPGEFSLRGGILDIFPLTGYWPVRLEFFGDQLESLRDFDPLTQISGREIAAVTLPPAGELGLLKQDLPQQSKGEPDAVLATSSPKSNPPLATLVDYLPDQTIFLLCEPEVLDEHARIYGGRIPANDRFLVAWKEILDQLEVRAMTALEVSELDGPPGAGDRTDNDPDGNENTGVAAPQSDAPAPSFQSLDAYRPLGTRLPEPHIAEAQRREFFAQLHRWLRQGYAVHVFCNNDGERQRFVEIEDEVRPLQRALRSPARSTGCYNERRDSDSRGATVHPPRRTGPRISL